MPLFKTQLKAAASLAILASALAVSAPPAFAADEKPLTPVEEGKKLAFEVAKGNCLACHMIQGGDMPGNIGPPLVAMKARFPDRDKLKAQIIDPTKLNPNSMMPPFGKHGVLSDAEIDKVLEFIYTL